METRGLAQYTDQKISSTRYYRLAIRDAVVNLTTSRPFIVVRVGYCLMACKWIVREGGGGWSSTDVYMGGGDI